jgi:membrane protein
VFPNSWPVETSLLTERSPFQVEEDPKSHRSSSSTEALAAPRKPLRELCASDVRSLLAETYSKWYKHRVPRLSAALAFYTALSLAPLLVVVISIAGFFFGQQAAQGQIVWQIQGVLGHSSAVAIEGVIEAARKPVAASLAALIGIGVSLFTATTVVAEMRDSLNTIWEVPVPELQGLKTILAFVRERFFSFALVLGVGFLLLVSLVINAGLTAAGTVLVGYVSIPPWLGQTTSTVASVMVATVLFGLVYKIMPDVDIEWRDVALGALVTSLLFNTGKLAVGMYLGRTTIASAYGAAGSLAVFLFWVYYSTLIFFLGAEFTQVFANRYGSAPTLRVRRILLGRLYNSAALLPPAGRGSR